jgi:hypothetical protein
MSRGREGQAWRVVGAGAGIAAGFVTRRALEALWRATRGGDPPSNPASSDTTWAEALIWAVASGAALAVMRLVAQRGAAELWRTATGGYPDELDSVRP